MAKKEVTEKATEKQEKENVITKTITTKHVFGLYEKLENGALRFVKDLEMESKKISDKKQKEILTNNGYTPENACLLFKESKYVKYEMPVKTFIENAKIVEK